MSSNYALLEASTAPEEKCRFCDNKEKTSDENPLLSSCRCFDGTRFAHRSCLIAQVERQKVSKSNTDHLKTKSINSYHCDRCHFEYDLKRTVVWSRSLTHWATTLSLSLLISGLLVYILGFIRLMNYSESKFRNHAANGFFVISIIGAAGTVILIFYELIQYCRKYSAEGQEAAGTFPFSSGAGMNPLALLCMGFIMVFFCLWQGVNWSMKQLAFRLENVLP